MKTINKNNYELFFMDYYDGNLKENQIAQLETFLLLNSDLQEEFEEFETLALKPDINVMFNRKSGLKKISGSYIFSQTDFEQQCIAQLEGDLDKEVECRFFETIENDNNLHEIWQQYKNIRLEPDKTIEYKKKEALKKNVVFLYNTRKILYTTISIAASLVVFFSIYTHFFNPVSIDNNVIAYEGIKNNGKEILKIKTGSDESELEKLSENRKPGKIAKTIQTQNNKSGLNTEKCIEKKIKEMTNTPEEAESIALIEGIYVKSLAGNVRDNESIAFIDIMPKTRAEITYSDEDLLFSDNIKERLSNRIKKAIKKDEDEKLRFWDLAEAGVKELSELTGKPMKLQNQYDENGKLQVFAFNSNDVEIAARIRKNK